MPNWCVSWVDIVGPEKSIDKVQAELEKAVTTEYQKNGFGDRWLGNLLWHIGAIDASGRPDIRCRGSIEDISRPEGGRLQLQTESAWGPHVTCIEMFALHYAQDVEVFYTAEEPGNGLYWSNDLNYQSRVCVDFWAEDTLPDDLWIFDGYEDLEKSDAIARLQEALDDTSDDLHYLVDAYNARLESLGSEAHLYVNPYVYVEIGELT